MRKNSLIQTGLILVAAVLLITAVSHTQAQQSPKAADAGPRRVKVLFLGDTGHHDPLPRCRDIYQVFGQRGIDVDYTQDLADLNTPNLNRYDVLLLYANWTSIKPDQEKALLDYVESGHGFAPIHCASYCFLNSPKLTAVMGGRFKSHSTGTFEETIAVSDHPIEKGLKPIKSWDETYVHEMHNEKDRTVLGYRIEGDRKEPYTWVRTQGKGRVFYTAWGHDQRTWGNTDFQALLERGVRWAAGDWAMATAASFKPFEYTDANIPSYLPGRGAAGAPVRKMQEPVSAEESMKHMEIPAGFSLKLIASEPQIKKPITMAFDERGRMWVAETIDYPNNIQPRDTGHDQLSYVESTKPDGSADKFHVFADHLSIPTSMVFANGGVIVAQTPDIIFLKDTKGTGTADVKKVLFTGFGTRDTHATVSNLHYGFDNWIYGTVGYSGFNGTVGDQKLSFSQGVFRFKSDGSKLEYLGSTTNNTWGMTFSEDGQIFGSTANGNPAWYLGIPNRYYEMVKGMSPGRLEPIADSFKFYPITDKIRQVDFFGGYTAGAGSELYTARSLPKNFWNRIAFVTEPTGHLVGKFIYEAKGSAFTARNDFTFLASDDEWTAPIAAMVGPNGAVWVIDWYNYIVQHNPTPQGFPTGKGGAYEIPLRDKRHGRVYEVSYDAGKPSPVLNLAGAGIEQLVAALKSDNMLWRMHGQRLLIERGDKAAIAPLIALAQDTSMDEIGLNPAAIHALWAIHGLGGFDGSNAAANAVAVKDLKHASAGVRKAAIDVMPRTADGAIALVDSNVLEDANPQVRKSALLALAEMPQADRPGAAVFSSLNSRQNANDRFIADASAIAAARQDAGFLKAVFAAHPAEGKLELTSGAPAVNLIPNPSFETPGRGGGGGGRGRGAGGAAGAAPWRERNYAGLATSAVDATVAHSGSRSLRIASNTGADSSMYVDVPVDAYTEYTLSAWIKTQGLKVKDGRGALLNIHLTDYRTPAVVGDSDWKKVEVSFNSGDRKTVSINCLFGGFGQATGTAWFDDIELRAAQSIGLPGNEGKVVRVVMDQYAQRGPVESVVSTVLSLKSAHPALASVVMTSLASNWPQGASPKLSDADVAALRDLMKSLPVNARDRMLALTTRWGRADLFADQAVALAGELRTAVANPSLDAAQRTDAARRLISVDDSAQSIGLLLKQITPQSPPEVQLAMLEALSDSRGPEIGKSLVAQWGQLTPTAQRAGLNLMLRRTPWTGAMLAGIESGAIDNRDLQPQQWQALTTNLDPMISDKARALQKATGRAPTADRKVIVDKLAPLADKPGDVARGQAVFEKNCAVCHTIEGKGGQVGPDLSGIGARARHENLIDIVDPNRAVEGTYRQWIVKTKNDVVSGRLFAESKTSVEIIDAAAKHFVIDRSDIEVLKGTDKSVMPEGMEVVVGEQGLTDLLEYLATSTVKKQ